MLQKYLFPLILIIMVGMGGWLGYSAAQQPNFQQISKFSAPSSLVAEPKTAPPKTLLIPKLEVEAAVEQVGEDMQGRMDVPKNVMNVSWYKPGFKAGEKGSAVMAGHLDSVSGAPAVFYNLGQLEKGDQVLIESEDDGLHKFVVTDKAIYDFDKLPLQEIFGPSDKPKLNLITCDGTFDQFSKNYSKRMVVYTELSD